MRLIGYVVCLLVVPLTSDAREALPATTFFLCLVVMAWCELGERLMMRSRND